MARWPYPLGALNNIHYTPYQRQVFNEKNIGDLISVGLFAVHAPGTLFPNKVPGLAVAVSQGEKQGINAG